MGVVEQASGSIEDCLDSLEETYSSFAINQTTLSVSTERYERIRANDDEIVDLHAKVRNDDGEVLHVRQDGSLTLPGVRTAVGEELEAAVCSAIEDVAGVSCCIDTVEQVTIIGVRDSGDDDRDTVYRLAVVFEGSHTDGTVAEDAVWEPSAAPLPHA